MKKLTKILYINIAVIILAGILAGCTSNTNEKATTDSPEKSSDLAAAGDDTTETDESTSTSKEASDTDEANDVSSEETVTNDSDPAPSENSDSNAGDEGAKETLSQYSSEQIEYARVWRQLGPNQDLQHLIVKHIPAGTPIDPDDDTSVGYPEDVIQLIGTRIVDGIVTYSGNGDGTINVYNIPRRWYGGFSPPDDIDEDAVREQMKEIINNPKLVYVDPGSDEEIIELIKLLDVL